MDVVVVESPAKAKTINKYLGSEYTVLATYGHVRDLPEKDGSVKPDLNFDMTWQVDKESEKHLSAIAKGHAVDRVSNWLVEQGHDNHLVEVGGEVRASGSKHGRPWTLGVDVPEEATAPGSQFAAIVSLTDQAMATSGNYRNHYMAGDVKVVHTLDPRIGTPALGEVASATVVAQDCRTADGWATALMVLGQPGLEHIREADGVDALLILAGDDGFTQVITAGFPAQ